MDANSSLSSTRTMPQTPPPTQEVHLLKSIDDALNIKREMAALVRAYNAASQFFDFDQPPGIQRIAKYPLLFDKNIENLERRVIMVMEILFSLNNVKSLQSGTLNNWPYKELIEVETAQEYDRLYKAVEDTRQELHEFTQLPEVPKGKPIVPER